MSQERGVSDEGWTMTTITMSRCMECGAIRAPSARVHDCYVHRNEWGERESTHYAPTELVDFALIENSARSHDA